MTTFAEQAEQFLKDSQNRNSRPIRPSTVRTYRATLNNSLLPALGSLPLQDVNNKALKSLVSQMVLDGYKPASIVLNINVVKQIVASAVNEDGDQLHPRTWNSDFIDLPAIENQKQPTIDANTLEQAIKRALPTDQVLWVLLAGTGLRISEAFALRAGPDDGINSFWLPLESKLIIRNQRRGSEFGPTKTKAGLREVDLSPALSEYLKKHLTNIVESGLLFPSDEDTYRAHLDGVPGFHCLRRFRITYLDLQSVPEGIKKFWAGHSGSADITSRYTKMGPEIQARKEWAAKAGLGFELPKDGE